ncbi:hypothetical protein [Burkholderia gladioli]
MDEPERKGKEQNRRTQDAEEYFHYDFEIMLFVISIPKQSNWAGRII